MGSRLSSQAAKPNSTWQLSHRNPIIKMAQAATKARIKYLTNTAQLYSQIAPETSAHLMLECGSFAAGNDIALKMSDLQKACSACGTILTPGWTSRSSVANNSRNLRRRNKSQNGRKHVYQESTKFVITECLTCNKSTSSPLEHVPIHFSSRTSNSLSQATEAKKEDQTPLPANLASKKRARARKQSGLHAMLQKSKSQTLGAPFPTLDLMDFMKMS